LRYTRQTLRDRLCAGLDAEPDGDEAAPASPGLPAAVLIGLVDRPDGPTVLLTKRTDHLKDHAGQICFPGGRIEPEDDSVEAQAYLRTLLDWRREKTVIHEGKTMHFAPEDGTYVYFRYDDSDTVMVAINKNNEAVALELSRFAERLEGHDTATDVVSGENESLGETLNLPPRSVRVLDLDQQ